MVLIGDLHVSCVKCQVNPGESREEGKIVGEVCEREREHDALDVLGTEMLFLCSVYLSIYIYIYIYIYISNSN